MTDIPTIRASVTREGMAIVIRLPMDRAHDLRVALQPCPCKAVQSHTGQEIRLALSQAIGKAAR